MTKQLVILGSTGSIGRQTLDVVQHLPIQVCALAAGTNTELLAQQCRAFQPRLAVMGTEAAAKELRSLLGDQKIDILVGEAGMIEAAQLPEADTVITSVVGTLGLRPTLAAIRAGKRIGLANKETLVCAGSLVMAEAKKWGAEIIPVDSEHSAIFQCLMGCHDRAQVKKLILTCSGGPFYGMSREELSEMTKADALRHPNWNMGPKITVDSATLMNKGLEVIEAMHLYSMPLERIEVAIHRQSIVHSLVEFCDGAIMAQLGVPDMRIPIQLALTYPDRAWCPAPELDLFSCGSLTFARPDMETFGCLRLAIDAARQGGTACAIMNAANEAAVGLCLEDKISLAQIEELVKAAMDEVPVTPGESVEEILGADRMAREAVLRQFSKL
ncbi:MAG: 1-deoxy-D-xylulose-5-phosphate reductoisomerase [Ruminococcaceae bacterium]|nr:1-deoxy-D-xylulose-5-phosphate reductoisomerase [Oscillospiraceae bacterium]